MTTTRSPRLVAPVQTLTETYSLVDNKFGRHSGQYATLPEARAARGPNRRRYTIDRNSGPRFQAGPCSWCGWTSPLHVVKSGADEEARTHRGSHTAEQAPR